MVSNRTLRDKNESGGHTVVTHQLVYYVKIFANTTNLRLTPLREAIPLESARAVVLLLTK